MKEKILKEKLLESKVENENSEKYSDTFEDVSKYPTIK